MVNHPSMDAKKLGLPEQLHLSPTKKLLSGFTLWIASALFLAASVLLLSNTTKGRVVFQGFNKIGVNSSLASSWPFSLPASSYPSRDEHNNNASAAAFGVVLGKVNPGNLTEDGIWDGIRDGESENLTNSVEIGIDGSLDQTSVQRNASMTGKSENLTGSVGVGNDDSSLFANGSLPVGEPDSSEISVKANLTGAGELIATRNEKEANLSSSGIADEKQTTEASNENCDVFDGRWEWDDSKPHYPEGSCPHIDRDFNCHANGRPDSGFVKWRWQPNGCDIPRLNATDFLERLRGKKLVFVGDSLNRNMWESLDYNCTVDFVGSPFLVRESSSSGANGTFETLRLDLMDKTTSMYHDADIIVFNTGHWWTHEKTSKGEDYYQEGNHVHARLKVLDAYKRALETWARWVDRSVDRSRTHVFFRGYSVTHFNRVRSCSSCHVRFGFHGSTIEIREKLLAFNKVVKLKSPDRKVLAVEFGGKRIGTMEVMIEIDF
ncbi:Protein trichome birefringence-like 2 [Linum grandiflorum]